MARDIGRQVQRNVGALVSTYEIVKRLHSENKEDQSMDIAKIQADLAAFAADRDWEQFHSPKNLSMALAGEAGELLEVFQWLTQEQSRRESLDAGQISAATDELADVLIYALRLADKLEIDIEAAVNTKIAKNAARYTVEASRGNAEKR
ncbi:MAG: nucleotide pyrophosphohydrolase [Pseudomonadota bacterium]